MVSNIYRMPDSGYRIKDDGRSGNSILSTRNSGPGTRNPQNAMPYALCVNRNPQLAPHAMRHSPRATRLNRRVIGLLVFLTVCFHLSTAPCSDRTDDELPVMTGERIRLLRSEIPPLDLSTKPVVSPDAVAYFRSYNIDFPGRAHFFGRFPSGDFAVAAHVFLPPSPRGTVFLLHGYFDHTGILKNLIRHCLEREWAVACFDLPGHGLSSGERGSVDDFSQYVGVLEDFVAICSSRLPKPYHVIGHSLGAAIILEFVFNTDHRDKIFDNTILVAPLIHHSHYNITRFQHFFTKPFVKRFPRNFRSNSSDPAFVRWVKQDPLQGRKIPLIWLEALYNWNERMQNYDSVSTPLLVIQGTADTVVDWRYNIRLLKEKCDSLTVKWIEDGRHQLLNERQPLRDDVLLTISSYLTVPDR